MMKLLIRLGLVDASPLYLAPMGATPVIPVAVYCEDCERVYPMTTYGRCGICGSLGVGHLPFHERIRPFSKSCTSSDSSDSDRLDPV